MHVAVLDRRFPHHSEYSGYGQLVRRREDVELIVGGWPRHAPNRLADAIVRRTRGPAYTHTSLGLELAAVRRMLRGHGARFVAHVDSAAAVAEIARLAGDPAGREKLGRDARDRALTFDWRACATVLSDVYRRAGASE